MGRGRRDNDTRTLAAALGRRRLIVPPDPNPLRTTRGEPLADGGARWDLPAGPVDLRPDGTLAHADGSVHRPDVTRREWPAGERVPLRATEPDDVWRALRSLSAAAPPLTLREQAALLDACAGDLGAAGRLEGAMEARRLAGPTSVWWAPSMADTGVERLEPGEFPEALLRWGAPLAASVGRPPAQDGPIYHLHLPEAMPVIWSRTELGGGAGDLLLTAPGAALYPVQIDAAGTPGCEVQVVGCDVFWPAPGARDG